MVVLNILFASIYIITGKFSLSLATVHVSASPVWPPTGIVLVAFMTFGYRIWPGVFLGAYIVNLTTAGNEITSLFIAGGNTLEGIIGAYLVGKYSGGQRVLDQPVGVFNFTILAAMVSTIVSPTIGVTSLALGGFARWEDLISIWYTWWLGDAAGNLIVAPLLLVWILNPRIVWSRRQFIEAI
ncbi:MAG TPA: MASE1 domain-containing protein, partial [Bacteroidota bacterium]|nr:MASE1 domain-containing protein [Bacteroidota bacterium]